MQLYRVVSCQSSRTFSERASSSTLRRVTFGPAVRARRQDLKLTLEKLAERSNVSPNYLGKVESEQARPSLDVAVSIAKALKTPLGSLVEPTVRRGGGATPQVLEPDESELLKAYATLTLESQTALLALLRSFGRKAR
ncbi:MAG: helix-turn-helix domain-containing protein [Polyangiales bacterium]